MRYMLLIYTDEKTEPKDGSPEQMKMFEGYGRFTEEVNKSGASQSSARLRPIADATSVRVRDGKTVVTDGPFAETREQLAGYYLLNCKDLDQAIALAAMIPGAEYGSIEVRPVFEM
ncbi:MAG: YciI family protein [Tepidiformaceae bacterium]